MKLSALGGRGGGTEELEELGESTGIGGGGGVSLQDRELDDDGGTNTNSSYGDGT